MWRKCLRLWLAAFGGSIQCCSVIAVAWGCVGWTSGFRRTPILRAKSPVWSSGLIAFSDDTEGLGMPHSSSCCIWKVTCIKPHDPWRSSYTLEIFGSMRANLYKTVLSPNIIQVFEAWKEMGCMDMHGPKSHLSIFCDFFCQDFSKQQTQYLTVEQALEDYAQLIRLLG